MDRQVGQKQFTLDIRLLDQDCPTSLWILRVASAALGKEESAGKMRGLICGERVGFEYPAEGDQKLDDSTILGL